MALTTPTSADEVIDRAINDVFLQLQEFGAKPSLKNSWLNALIVGYANRVFDFYFALDQAALECLPDTATPEAVGGKLERIAAIWGITRIPGAQAKGSIIATGVVASEIPNTAIYVVGDGGQYTVDTAITITTKSLSVASIVRSATTATLTTTVPHRLATNVKINVTGAVETEYNVTSAAITILDEDTITYQVAGSPSSPATGTILLGFDTAIVDVTSVNFDDAADQVADAGFTLESPLVGVDDVARADTDSVVGGADQETTDALRTRLLDRIQNPVAHFNVADITAKAKTVAGVTRVFVQEITPSVGQVTVYFMRDNDDVSTIPDGAEVAAVKAVLDTIRPANTDPDDLIVLAPTALPTDFTFTSTTPSTATMKAAVEASLVEFFAEKTSVGVDVTSDEYRAAIFNTVDTVTGDILTGFILSTPVGLIGVSSGQIATLGAVVIP